MDGMQVAERMSAPWSLAPVLGLGAAPRHGRRLARTSVPINAKVKLSGRNLGRDVQRAFPRNTDPSSCLAARVRAFSSDRKHAPVRIADPFIVMERERRA
jgi:hypothetical protein